MTPEREPLTIEIAARRVVTPLAIVLFALASLHVLFMIVLGPRLPNSPLSFVAVNLFDLSAEANIPTFWSTFLLLVAGPSLFLIAKQQKRDSGRYWHQWAVWAGRSC